jgi:hypothetical protein
VIVDLREVATGAGPDDSTVIRRAETAKGVFATCAREMMSLCMECRDAYAAEPNAAHLLMPGDPRNP